jgi:hypothetical protein
MATSAPLASPGSFTLSSASHRSGGLLSDAEREAALASAAAQHVYKSRMRSLQRSVSASRFGEQGSARLVGNGLASHSFSFKNQTLESAQANGLTRKGSFASQPASESATDVDEDATTADEDEPLSEQPVVTSPSGNVPYVVALAEMAAVSSVSVKKR